MIRKDKREQIRDRRTFGHKCGPVFHVFKGLDFKGVLSRV